MSIEEIGIVTFLFVVLSVIGLVICYFILGKTLRFVFTIAVVYLTGLMFITGLIVCYYGMTIINLLCVACVMGFGCQLIISWFMKYLITPIKSINDGLELLSKGDFTQQMQIEREDELGNILQKMNIMTEEISVLVQSIKENSGDNLEMAANLSDVSGQMSEDASSASLRADKVASAARTMSSSMNSVVAAMGQASENISMVASAVEENTVTINEIANNSEKARTVSNDAVSQARYASGRVEALGIAVRDVDKVTGTITEISEQTNLLALNATIEAARAGEAGKGFAVVAGEIKELARQTSESTQEIRALIEGIQGSAASTIADIENITGVINTGNDIVTSIAASVEEQAATTSEIAENVGQASKGINEINNTVAESLAVSEKIAEDISNVNKDAGRLSDSSLSITTSAGELSMLAEVLQERLEKFIVLDNRESSTRDDNTHFDVFN